MWQHDSWPAIKALQTSNPDEPPLSDNPHSALDFQKWEVKKQLAQAESKSRRGHPILHIQSFSQELVTLG